MSRRLSRWLVDAPEGEELFSDAALLEAMLRFEVALAAAQADLGLIPAAAAASIAQYAMSFRADAAVLASAGALAGSPIIPFARALTAHVAEHDPQAARHVHFGTTSQDVLDTALVLCARSATSALSRRLLAAYTAAAGLARRHKSVPALARTLLQPAGITTLGFQAAQWAHALARTRSRLLDTASRALAVSLGGAMGNLAAYADKGAALRDELARRLGLADPGASWHTLRDQWIALATDAALCAGIMAKIARDLALRMQAEIGEAAEPQAPGRGGSSAMPHKRNPALCMRVVATAQPIPGMVASLLAAMPQEHERALGNWQAEMATFGEVFVHAVSAAKSLSELLEGMHFDPARCRANIDALHGTLFSEGLAALLSPALGKTEAQDTVAQWCTDALTTGGELRELARDRVRNDRRLAMVPDDEIDAVFDVQRAASSSVRQVDALLERSSDYGRPASDDPGQHDDPVQHDDRGQHDAGS